MARREVAGLMWWKSFFWNWHRHHHRHHHHHHHPHKHIRGRFAGAYWIDPDTGDFIVAVQTVPVSTAITAPLIFTQTSSDPNVPPKTVPGPVGVVSSSDPNVSPSLSADGQSVNLTTPSSGTFTLTWHDPAGNVADFSVTLTDEVPVLTVTGQFGTFVPGTTP